MFNLFWFWSFIFFFVIYYWTWKIRLIRKRYQQAPIVIIWRRDKFLSCGKFFTTRHNHQECVCRLLNTLFSLWKHASCLQCNKQIGITRFGWKEKSKHLLLTSDWRVMTCETVEHLFITFNGCDLSQDVRDLIITFELRKWMETESFLVRGYLATYNDALNFGGLFDSFKDYWENTRGWNLGFLAGIDKESINAPINSFFLWSTKLPLVITTN